MPAQHEYKNVAKFSILRLCLLLRCADMRIVYLCGELQTGDGFLEMGLQRRHHDEHERFRVTSKRVLKKVCQLCGRQHTAI
jgi:hypothetical protein